MKQSSGTVNLIRYENKRLYVTGNGSFFILCAVTGNILARNDLKGLHLLVIFIIML